ncbi:MAG: 3-isopropylmalate dehydratase large subunit, partial [Peptococcaceae bacterium]|nr:3-isopropylmalate dehydratase large subunit [Peptococcaceae bacterium]
MSMTITEKIIAAHAGLTHVEPGEIVTVDVDLGMTNELAAAGAIPLLESLKSKKKFHNPKAAVIVADHYTPARDINAARMLKTIRDYYSQHGAVILEMGYGGIEHVVIPEQGYALPGQIIIAADSHTTTYGALGAFSTGVGTTDLAAVWATGKTWLKVPQTLLVEFHGKRKPWVSGRDFIQYLLGKIGTDGARYRAIEFRGEAVEDLNMADRFTMSNLSVEGGAKNAIFHVDDKTIEYVKNA